MLEGEVSTALAVEKQSYQTNSNLWKMISPVA